MRIVKIHKEHLRHVGSDYMPVQVILSLVFAVASPLCTVLFFISYRKYCRHFKLNHYDKYKELMNKDPVVDAVGEWIRWPVGSVYLLMSLFSTTDKSLNMDTALEKCQKQSRIYLYALAVNFVIFFLLLALNA